MLTNANKVECFLVFVDCMSPTVQGMNLVAGSEIASAKKQITLLLIRLFKMVSYNYNHAKMLSLKRYPCYVFSVSWMSRACILIIAMLAFGT